MSKVLIGASECIVDPLVGKSPRPILQLGMQWDGYDHKCHRELSKR
ncbi:hypothetical protein BH10CYA1_BH10CYA1_09380 [soil metagenome]